MDHHREEASPRFSLAEKSFPFPYISTYRNHPWQIHCLFLDNSLKKRKRNRQENGGKKEIISYFYQILTSKVFFYCYRKVFVCSEVFNFLISFWKEFFDFFFTISDLFSVFFQIFLLNIKFLTIFSLHWAQILMKREFLLSVKCTIT